MPLNLYDTEDHHKYLTAGERDAFLKAAEDAPREVRRFCGTLLFTGCRISEALGLTADGADLNDRRIVFESLKKRKRGVYRPVPVPPVFLDTLDLVHNIRAMQKRPDRGKGIFLWDWCRTTAWTRVGEVMKAAKINGPQATPKGLRHGFGIRAVTGEKPVPLNMVKKWLGHADLKTTSIYVDAVGAEEDQVAGRMW
jgi:integrase/recombinase XerD